MIRAKIFGVKLKASCPPPLAAGLNKHVHVLLARQKELQEADTLVSTGLEEAEENQVIVQTRLGQGPYCILTIARKPLDGVLGAIVVPGDTIMVDERE